MEVQISFVILPRAGHNFVLKLVMEEAQLLNQERYVDNAIIGEKDISSNFGINLVFYRMKCPLQVTEYRQPLVLIGES